MKYFLSTIKLLQTKIRKKHLLQFVTSTCDNIILLSKTTNYRKGNANEANLCVLS